jgi:hypothetical protein
MPRKTPEYIRRHYEVAENFDNKGNTAEGSMVVNEVLAETLIEILATLQEIADTLEVLAGVQKVAAPQKKASK